MSLPRASPCRGWSKLREGREGRRSRWLGEEVERRRGDVFPFPENKQNILERVVRVRVGRGRQKEAAALRLWRVLFLGGVSSRLDKHQHPKRNKQNKNTHSRKSRPTRWRRTNEGL